MFFFWGGAKGDCSETSHSLNVYNENFFVDITNLLGFWGNQDFSWSVRGNNPPVHSNTKSDREREGETGRERERGADSRLKPN